MSEKKLHPDKPYTSAQVARLVFGHGVEWFYAWRAREGAAEGFPAPISDHGHPRWSGARLLAWMARPRKAALPKVLQGATIVDIRAALAARSKLLAQKNQRGA